MEKIFNQKSVNDTGGKFGKFETGVVDTRGAS